MSFLKLERLNTVDRNIAYADQSTTAQPVEVTIGAIDRPPEHGNTMYSHDKTPRLRRQVNLLFVFIVGSWGTQKRCFLRSSQLRKLERPVTKSHPRLGSRVRKAVGLVAGLVPRIKAQVGKLCLTVLQHSGFVRSLTSF